MPVTDSGIQITLWREWTADLPCGKATRVRASVMDNDWAGAVYYWDHGSLLLLVRPGREDEDISALLTEIQQREGKPLDVKITEPAKKGPSQLFRVEGCEALLSFLAVRRDEGVATC